MEKPKQKITPPPQEKQIVYFVDVPKVFVEYCIKESKDKEQKKELKKLLETHPQSS